MIPQMLSAPPPPPPRHLIYYFDENLNVRYPTLITWDKLKVKTLFYVIGYDVKTGTLL